MSVIEEDHIIAPWIGPGCCKNVLTVIVLSSNVEMIEMISTAIHDVHSRGDFRWKLIILRSLNMEAVVKQTHLSGSIALDFVVIALDTNRLFCLDWAKKVIDQVHPDLRARRVLLVNANGLPRNGMTISTENLLMFQTKYNLDILTANVFKTNEAEFMARRLLRYIEVSIGVNTGFPNINV